MGVSTLPQSSNSAASALVRHSVARQSAIDDAIAKEHRLGNRRRFPRWQMSAEVTAVPLDADSHALGPVLRGWSSNVSTGGICFLSDEPVRLYCESRAPCGLLLLEIAAADSAPIRTVMTVLRIRRVNGLWVYAGGLAEADREILVTAR
jgi:hypothetical protein